MFDQGGWKLIRKNGVPYLIPPKWVDADQKPRRAGRPGLPEDTAAVVAFLASAGAGFVTGQEIPVNGGTRPPNM